MRRVLLPLALAALAAAHAAAYNVKDFGARGDGKAEDTAAIRAALSAASRAGGGTVELPAGTYPSGSIEIPSHTTLWLHPGAVLQAIEDGTRLIKDENSSTRYFIVAKRARNIAIRGEGTIRGTGEDDYGWRWGVPMTRPFRTHLVELIECEEVRIEGVTLLQSESFTLVLNRCRSVVVHGISLLNNLHHENTDGIDIFSSADVRISDCRIEAGDDAIVLKTSQPGAPCERILVTNCTLRTTCSGLKFGTGTRSDFRDIHFSNIAIRHGEQGIAMFMKDGAVIENVTFSSISIRRTEAPSRYPTLADVRNDPTVRRMLDDKSATFADYNIWMNLEEYPIFIDLNRRNASSPYGVIRAVTFRDIHIRSRSGILIQGRPERPIENLRMSGIAFDADDVIDYATRHLSVGGTQNYHDEYDTLYARKPSYFTVAHTEWFELDGFRLTLSKTADQRFARSAVDFHRSTRGQLIGVSRNGSEGGATPTLRLVDCRNVLVDRAAGIIEVAGESSAELTVRGGASVNIVAGARDAVRTIE